jgi:hypothetical protein
VVLCRLSGLAAAWFLARLFDLPAGFVSAAMLIRGLPGVALQIVLVPLVVRQLERSRNILIKPHDNPPEA